MYVIERGKKEEETGDFLPEAMQRDLCDIIEKCLSILNHKYFFRNTNYGAVYRWFSHANRRAVLKVRTLEKVQKSLSRMNNLMQFSSQ